MHRNAPIAKATAKSRFTENYINDSIGRKSENSKYEEKGGGGRVDDMAYDHLNRNAPGIDMELLEALMANPWDVRLLFGQKLWW